MMIDFTSVSTDVCTCLNNMISNQLNALSGLATSYVRDRVQHINTLTQNVMNNTPPFGSLNDMFEQTRQLQQQVENQITQGGLSVPSGSNISRFAKCLGNDLRNKLTGVSSNFDPSDLFGPLVHALAGIETLIPNLLHNLDLNLATRLNVCEGADNSDILASIDITLGTLSIDPTTRLTDTSQLASLIGLTGEQANMFSDITSQMSQLTKISNNILPILKKAPDVLNLFGTVV